MELSKFSAPAIELITWIDIDECPQTWASESDIQDWLKDECLVEQVGFVIAEDQKYLLIADSFIESDQSYSNVHRIPKGVITKRIKLDYAS